MFSLTPVAILICALSLYAYIYHLFGCVLFRIASYYYRIAIIIDRFLIIEKGRGGLVSTNVQISKLHDKRMSQKEMIKYILGLWKKQRLELEFFILII